MAALPLRLTLLALAVLLLALATTFAVAEEASDDDNTTTTAAPVTTTTAPATSTTTTTRVTTTRDPAVPTTTAPSAPYSSKFEGVAGLNTSALGQQGFNVPPPGEDVSPADENILLEFLYEQMRRTFTLERGDVLYVRGSTLANRRMAAAAAGDVRVEVSKSDEPPVAGKFLVDTTFYFKTPAIAEAVYEAASVPSSAGGLLGDVFLTVSAPVTNPDYIPTTTTTLHPFLSKAAPAPGAAISAVVAALVTALAASL